MQRACGQNSPFLIGQSVFHQESFKDQSYHWIEHKHHVTKKKKKNPKTKKKQQNPSHVGETREAEIRAK